MASSKSLRQRGLQDDLYKIHIPCEQSVPRLRRAVWPPGSITDSNSKYVQPPRGHPPPPHRHILDAPSICSRGCCPTVRTSGRDANNWRMTSDPAFGNRESRETVSSYMPGLAGKQVKASERVKTVPLEFGQDKGKGLRSRQLKREEWDAGSDTCNSDETWSGDSDEQDEESDDSELAASESGGTTGDTAATEANSPLDGATLKPQRFQEPASLWHRSASYSTITMPPGHPVYDIASRPLWKVVRQLGKAQWRCGYPNCGVEFKGYEFCARHVKGVHARKEVEAIMAGKMKLADAYAIQEFPEVATQQHQDSLTCPKCGKRLSRSDAARRHYRTCRRSKPIPRLLQTYDE